jgi:hypothetical protein
VLQKPRKSFRNLEFLKGDCDMTDQPTPRAIRLTESELKAVVKDTVHETFVALGVDAKEPIEMQKDFSHLRYWRETTESAKSRTIMGAVTIVVAGTLGLVWMALTGGKA